MWQHADADEFTLLLEYNGFVEGENFYSTEVKGKCRDSFDEGEDDVFKMVVIE